MKERIQMLLLTQALCVSLQLNTRGQRCFRLKKQYVQVGKDLNQQQSGTPAVAEENKTNCGQQAKGPATLKH